MASTYNFGRGGGRGGRGRGYVSPSMEMWETHHGKPPIRTRINPDPISGYYKLHVRSIPTHWSENTLANAFRKVGYPASVYLNKTGGPYNWAFVEFETYHEASEAIKQLNNNIVLDGIVVKFAREKATDGIPFLDESNDPTFELLNDPVQPIVPSSSTLRPTPEVNTPLTPKMFPKTIKNDHVLSTSIARHSTVLPVCPLEDITNLENAIFERIQCIFKTLAPSFKCEVCGKGSNQSCGNCCIHYCSRQCQIKDWPSHSRICVPVNDDTKTRGQANGHGGKNANVRQSELTNGYRAAHESEWNSRPQNNRTEDKPYSRYEDRQSFDSKYNERQNNKVRNHYDDGKNDRGNLSRDRSRPGNQSERSKTMFEERKSRFMSNKQIKSEAEDDSWDATHQKESSQNDTQSHKREMTSQSNFNDLFSHSENAKPVPSNQRNEREASASIDLKPAADKMRIKPETSSSIDLKPEADKVNTDTSEPVEKPTCQISSSATNTDTSEPVEKPTCQISSSATVNDPELIKSFDLEPGAEEEVLVIHVESSGVLYVQKNQHQGKFVCLHTKLNAPTTVYVPFSPTEHSLCASRFDGTWSRCKVTSLNPLTVLYIDFGNSETLALDRLFTLPDTLAADPPFAIKIKLVDGSPTKHVNDCFFIKPVNKVDDYWLAQVAGVMYSQPATVCSPESASNTMQLTQNPPVVPTPSAFPKLLPAEVFTKVSVRHKESTHLAVTPVTVLPELDELSARIQVEAGSAAPLTPAITKCLAYSQKYNHWCRGRVVQLEPLLVKLVDFGSTEICKPDHLRHISSQFSSILPFVVYIKPNHGAVEELYNKSELSVKPLYKDDSGCWIVEVDLTETTQSENISSVTGSSITQSGVMPKMPKIDSSTQIAASTQVLPTPAQTIVQPQQDITFPEFLNRDQFTTVLIMCLDEQNSGGDTYFIGKTSIIATITEMSAYFGSVSKDVLVSPRIGDIGLALYLFVWYRVKVVNQSPLRVMYIDYGNTETISPEELKICPTSHKDVLPLAYKVRLAPGTNKKYYNLPGESQLSIKPVSLSADGSILVQIEGETYSEPPVTPEVTENLHKTGVKTLTQVISDTPVLTQEVQSEDSPIATELSSVAVETCPEPQHILDLLKRDYKLLFIANKVDPARNMVLGTLLSSTHFPDSEVAFSELDTIMETEAYDPNFTPREGELVACKIKEDWQRAQLLVLERKQWLSLVDHGTIIAYDSCKKLPSQFSRAPFLAAILKLSPPVDMDLLKTVQVTLTISVEVKEVGTAGCVVQVHLEEREFTAELEKWEYNAFVWPLPLPTGALVTISKVVNSNTFLVAPANDDMQLQQTIQIECIQAKCKEELQFHPKIGEHVVAEVNSIYCRARIVNIDSSNNLCTLYNIDLGSEFPASLNSLQPMPPTLYKWPCKISPVVLKDVEKIALADLPKLAKLFISKLVEQEKQLRVDFCPVLGVTLMSDEDGQLINEMLKELLVKTIIPDEMGKFTLDCLILKEPPMDKELNLLVTFSDPLYVQKYDDANEFHTAVHEPLQNYANSDSAPYNPCMNELCIVRFGDEWYRATCGRETNTGISHVFLVDYGNILEVQTSDIRKINADFLTYPCFGFLCEIKGLPSEISPQLRARLNEILQLNSIHLGIFESKNGDKYYVNLPSVLTTLRLEGLIP